MDDEITEVVEALPPQNISEISNEKVRSVHQLLLSDYELREVSRSIQVVADSIDGSENISTQTHFQLMQLLILINDEEYKPTIVALAR